MARLLCVIPMFFGVVVTGLLADLAKSIARDSGFWFWGDLFYFGLLSIIAIVLYAITWCVAARKKAE